MLLRLITLTTGFQWSFRPNMVFPTLFANSGYKTAGYGKIFHWDGKEKNIWNHDQWDGGWYDYQEAEISLMNSSTMADKIKPVEEFRDYIYTSKAIETMKQLHTRQEFFMVGLGYKLPHLQVHVPFKYFDMYRNKQHMWRRRKKELKFPNSAPIVAHKCCGAVDFQFMNKDGGEKFVEKENIGRMNQPFSQRMHTELSWGYAAAVTFLDAQIGRLLDTIDDMKLWDNITIVLTSDHGMHNGTILV
jgi:arylsulfatase A-like enzyme